MLWPNRHRRSRRRLSAYLDSQLTAAEAEALESHLTACPACRQMLEGLRATVLALRDLPQEEAPRSFALTPEQAGRPAAPPGPRPGAPALATGMRLAGATLAFALAVVLIIDLGDLGGGGREEAARQPAQQFAAQTAGPEEGNVPASRDEAETGLKEISPSPAPLPATAAGEERPDAQPGETPAAAEQRGEGGALDPLRATEIALAATAGFLVAGGVALAYAGRKE